LYPRAPISEIKPECRDSKGAVFAGGTEQIIRPNIGGRPPPQII